MTSSAITPKFFNVHVAFDISHLNHEKLSGVGVYTLELLRALRAEPNLEMIPVWRPGRWKSRRFFRQHVGRAQAFIPGLAEYGARVLHGPDFRVGRTRGARRVASIMDLAFLKAGMTSPEFAAKKTRDLNVLLDERTPDALIAISEATKRDLIAYRPALADRISVTLLGGDHMQMLASPLDDKLTRAKPYFLFVGNLEARKNVLGVLRAFETTYARTPEVELLLIGKPGFEGDKILAAVKESPAQSAIRVLGYCGLADLQAYYRHALALVYPSWIEGFGIPVVEAMQLRCPVITSAGTSTEEIADDCGWLVEPGDPLALAKAMWGALELSGDHARREFQLQRAFDRASRFTWQRCAEQTAQVYHSVSR